MQSRGHAEQSHAERWACRTACRAARALQVRAIVTDCTRGTRKRTHERTRTAEAMRLARQEALELAAHALEQLDRQLRLGRRAV